ncbi:endonuclease VII domain-containing protein [Nocardia aobensis]|uniref:Endonuclease VII domain-containing protein n=1 Tax=Nocardia aobensis TaxID=257277 RepID=A0ABW6P5N1_9NOCA
MTEAKRCKDCAAGGATTNRPLVDGIRCATHAREFKKAAKLKAHARHVEKTYKMSGEAYWALYEAQGRHCAICERATGASKLLSVDHDHSCCPKTPTCGECNRGLLCGPCNKLLGHGRDDPEFFARAADYLQHPPASLIGMDR